MNKLLVFIVSLFGSAYCFDLNYRTEAQLWESLYYNDASLSHKLLLSRIPATTSDYMLTNLLFVYRAYKMGDKDQVMSMLDGLDELIRIYYIAPQEQK